MRTSYYLQGVASFSFGLRLSARRFKLCMRKNAMMTGGRGGEGESELVSWCFEPSQPQRITSGLINRERKEDCNPLRTLKLWCTPGNPFCYLFRFSSCIANLVVYVTPAVRLAVATVSTWGQKGGVSKTPLQFENSAFHTRADIKRRYRKLFYLHK